MALVQNLNVPKGLYMGDLVQRTVLLEYDRTFRRWDRVGGLQGIGECAFEHDGKTVGPFLLLSFALWLVLK